MIPPADRPIMFTAPMVRAILDGNKTQTRRAMKQQPKQWPGAGGRLCDVGLQQVSDEPWPRVHIGPVLTSQEVRFRPGMKLWVKEAWRIATWKDDGRIAVDYRASPEDDRTPWISPEPNMLRQMRAGSLREAELAAHKGIGSCRLDSGAGGYFWNRGDSPCRWRPSIHMPRIASRLTLEVTEVRVQRLHEITEEEALAEGVVRVREHCHVIRGFGYDAAALCHSSAITPFSQLWDQINGAGAWDANPFVVAITFKPHRVNIDALDGAALPQAVAA